MARFGLPSILMKWIAFLYRKNATRSVVQHTIRLELYPQHTKLVPVFFVVMINYLQRSMLLTRASFTIPFLNIRIAGTDTQRETEAKIIGITITSNLTWDVYIDEITRKAGKRLFLLLQLKRSGIPVEDFPTVYIMVARPTLETACLAWSTSLTLGLQSDMARVQRRAIEALVNAQLPSLKQRRAHLCDHFYKKKSNTRRTNCITYYQKEGLQHIIPDVVLDILYP